MRTLILNENKLVEYCLKGDRRSQEALYHEFYEDLYKIGRRYLANHQDAEDAVLQTYSKVFKSLVNFQYQGEGSLGKWIRTIMIHEAIKMIKRRRSNELNDALDSIQIENPEADSLAKMQASDLMKMIESLPTGYRMVFNLYVIEGYNHKEIGELMKISESTSKTQLMKARKALMSSINTEERYGTH